MATRSSSIVTRTKRVRAKAAKQPKPAKLPKRKTADTETEYALLAAADALLMERGSLDFSLAEVAARTNLSAALVSYYFGSKHGLLSALLEWSSGQAVKQLHSLLVMDFPAVVKLKLHVRALVKTYAKAPYLDRLLHHLIDASDAAEAKRISDFYVMRVVSFYRELIAQGVREQTLRPIDPMDLYLIMLGTADHLAARRRILTSALGTAELGEDFVRHFADAFYEILLSGMRSE